jgi:hypothetical protein
MHAQPPRTGSKGDDARGNQDGGHDSAVLAAGFSPNTRTPIKAANRTDVSRNAETCAIAPSDSAKITSP